MSGLENMDIQVILGERQHVTPIIWLIIHIASQVLFLVQVSSLGLAIGLGVEKCGKISLNRETLA